MKKSVIILLVLLITCLCACAPKPENASATYENETAPIVFVETQNVEKQTETNENDETLNIKRYIRSKVDSLVVRAGTKSSSASLGTLDKDDMVVWLGNEGDRYKTYFRGRVAYVSALTEYTEIFEMKTAAAQVEAVISEGEKLLGTPYVYGATRLHDGYGNLLKGFTTEEFDCSSYMQYIFYYGAGAILHSTTRTQVGQGKKVDRTELMRGDLIFMTNASRKNNTGIERIGHVAMWLGDGYIMHTASDHAVIEKMTDARWDNYITARKML